MNIHNENPFVKETGNPKREGEFVQGKEKKRRKKVTETEDVLFLQDPLAMFGTDIMTIILSFLDARSVALSLLVSRPWHGVASRDRLWETKCAELWPGKAHIPRSPQFRGLSKLETYSLMVMDGKRSRITREDLCGHTWEFHYNKAAPEYWRNLDPFWTGTGPLMRRCFSPDGSLTADPKDEVWGGHESCYTIVTSIIGEDQIREHYVRINRWPRLSISRKPDWSWEMSNTLFSYASVPDTKRDGGTGPLFACT